MTDNIGPHEALIYAMVLVSAADGDMTDAELREMGEIIRFLPVFRDYERTHLPATAAACAEILDDEEGLDQALDLVEGALTPKLRETAYALACDIAAADREVHQEEMRMLEMIRHRLGIDRLIAAAIERGARARFTSL